MALQARTCTVTYTYTKAASALTARVIATARVAGHTRVVGHGRLRHGKLTFTLTDPHTGRYRVTLLVLRGHGQRGLLGHTTVIVR
jgi:hypothetical protein